MIYAELWPALWRFEEQVCQLIGKALNHKNQVFNAIYARLDKDPVLEAINTAIELMSKN